MFRRGYDQNLQSAAILNENLKSFIEDFLHF